jgi:hypothetical protein
MTQSIMTLDILSYILLYNYFDRLLIFTPTKHSLSQSRYSPLKALALPRTFN